MATTSEYLQDCLADFLGALDRIATATEVAAEAARREKSDAAAAAVRLELGARLAELDRELRAELAAYGRVLDARTGDRA